MKIPAHVVIATLGRPSGISRKDTVGKKHIPPRAQGHDSFERAPSNGSRAYDPALGSGPKKGGVHMNRALGRLMGVGAIQGAAASARKASLQASAVPFSLYIKGIF